MLFMVHRFKNTRKAVADAAAFLIFKLLGLEKNVSMTRPKSN